MRLFWSIAAFACVLAVASATRAELKFPTTNPAGTLRAGDVVEFTVSDLHGPGVATALTVRVDEQGKITLPLAGEIEVAGQTNDASAALVSKAYEKASVMPSCTVTVAIVATAAQMPVKPGPLAAGDTLRVTVFELTGPGKRTDIDAAVAPDGTVTLPLIGKAKIAGQTDGRAAGAIAKAYKDGQIMSVPMVSVLRTGSGSEVP